MEHELYRIYGLTPDANWQSFDIGLAFTHPEDLNYVLKEVSESQNSGRDFSTNYRIVDKKGSIRHIYSEGRLEFDATGKPRGLYGITHDVTEKILLENELMQERLARQREITGAVLTAQENERLEIGKELHDNLTQILGAAKLYIEMAKTDEVNRPMFLDKSSAFIVNVIEEIRKISKNLADPVKQALDLFASIKILLDDLAMVHPLKIQFQASSIKETDVSEKLQLTIFRIVQEQVNNILKHSLATQASISLRGRDNEIILLISDNGEGCDTSAKKNGVGIINIKSRAELYQGTVTIVSKPGKGYNLEVAFLLQDHIDKSTVLNKM